MTGADWKPSAFAKYDRVTFAEFVRAQGASPDAIALLSLGMDTLPSAFSALAVLREAGLEKRIRRWYMAPSGNDRLPAAMAAPLGDRIHYGAAVRGIEPGKNAVRVHYDQGHRRRQLTAGRVICSIPFSVLKRIPVVPEFSPSKSEAIRTMEYVPITRVYWQTRRRFWEDENLFSLEMASTDLMMSRVWQVTANQPGERGILLSYVLGRQAQRLRSMRPDHRVPALLADMHQVQPGLRTSCERTVTKCWSKDPWARGGFALSRPGQLTSMLQIRRAGYTLPVNIPQLGVDGWRGRWNPGVVQRTKSRRLPADENEYYTFTLARR